MIKSMDNLKTKRMLTIDDLYSDVLTLILNHLSVKQKFNCLNVCQKWYQIITELLNNQNVLSLNYNDINCYTNEELSQKCSNCRHLAVNSSVGRVIGKRPALFAVYLMPSFSKFGQNFLKLFNFCPNLRSLDLSQHTMQLSDINSLLTKCPQLECLYMTTDEKRWTQFLCPMIAGLKHFSLTLTTQTRTYREFANDLYFSQSLPQIEEMIIKIGFLNDINLGILSSFLLSYGTQLKKFHLITDDMISASDASEIIQCLVCKESDKSMIKDVNLNVEDFDTLFDSITNHFPDIESLYIHINENFETNTSLKSLKKLQNIYLDFNSNVNVFSMDGLHSESDLYFNGILPTIPSTVTKLTIFDAVLSLSLFIELNNCLQNLQELEMSYVLIENDIQTPFWQIISNFKTLRKLSLNTTDISDEGLEHLMDSQCLNTLELVKYKGPNAAKVLIDSFRVIHVFSGLASLKPKQWFDLRLDMDVIEVTEDIKRLVPRNVRLINIGFKK